MITFNPIMSNRTGNFKQKNCYALRMRQDLKKDTLAFTGINRVALSDINRLSFPRRMYLSKKSLAMAENYNSDLFSRIGKIFSKRLDYMGLTEEGVLSSFSYAENKNLPAKFVIREKGVKSLNQKKSDVWEVDWTPAYREIRDLLDLPSNDAVALKKEVERILISHKIIKA